MTTSKVFFSDNPDLIWIEETADVAKNVFNF